MEDNQVAATATASDSGLSVAGLWQVFTGPSAFFERLKKNPKIIVPWIALVIVAFIVAWFTWEYGARLQIEMMEGYVERGFIPQSEVPTLESLQTQSLITILFFCILPSLLAAGLAMLVGNFMMSGKATFKQVFSVMIYGELLFWVGQLVKVPLIMAKDSLNVTFSLALLVGDRGPTDPLWVALDKIGVFYIWEWAVIGIGLAAVYGFTRAKGYWLAVLSMGLLSLLHIIITFVQNMFLG
ncbi:MAG: YIP1 family protein [bacterium]|nr:YIP1 family protein [bacterium]